MAGLLELEDVVAGYGQSDILHALSLGIEAGGITCIVGPNGAGKSTLLRVISGLLRPRSGEIRFQDEPIAGLSPRAILDRGIVHVPQERSLFRTMTVHENVLLGGYRLPTGRCSNSASGLSRMHSRSCWSGDTPSRARAPGASRSSWSSRAP